MTNPDQDVTLDEMVSNIEHFMIDNGDDNRWSIDMTVQSMDVIITNENGKIRRGEWNNSLDVITEVEEALKQSWHHVEYTYQLRAESTIKHECPYNCNNSAEAMVREYKIATADPETRLRAIYATLRESGEI